MRQPGTLALQCLPIVLPTLSGLSVQLITSGTMHGVRVWRWVYGIGPDEFLTTHFGILRPRRSRYSCEVWIPPSKRSVARSTAWHQSMTNSVQLTPSGVFLPLKPPGFPLLSGPVVFAGLMWIVCARSRLPWKCGRGFEEGGDGGFSFNSSESSQ